jgi:SAM-dependent methyltransferase
MIQLGLAIHGAMLADRLRNQSLAAAIESIVRPGDVVIDVGAGSGLLSMLAARAGASRVYAVESASIAMAARRLIAQNGLSGQIEVTKADSIQYEPPERADVILCETLGFAGLDEGFRSTMADARDRMLRPGGRLLPRSVNILAAPVRISQNDVSLTSMDEILGFDYALLADVFRRVYQRRYVAYEDELGSPTLAFHLDCHRMVTGEPLSTHINFRCTCDGQVGGFVLWFEAELSPGIRMTSRSPEPSNHWGQAFLPLPEPIFCKRDEELKFFLEVSDSRGQFLLTWNSERTGS